MTKIFPPYKLFFVEIFVKEKSGLFYTLLSFLFIHVFFAYLFVWVIAALASLGLMYMAIPDIIMYYEINIFEILVTIVLHFTCIAIFVLSPLT